MSDKDQNTQESERAAQSYINAIGGSSPFGNVTENTRTLASAPDTDAQSRVGSSPISPGTRQRNLDDAYSQLTGRAPSYGDSSDPPPTAARSSTPIDDLTRQRELDDTMSALTGGRTTQYESRPGSTTTAGPADDRASRATGQSSMTVDFYLDEPLAASLRDQDSKDNGSKRD